MLWAFHGSLGLNASTWIGLQPETSDPVSFEYCQCDTDVCKDLALFYSEESK